MASEVVVRVQQYEKTMAAAMAKKPKAKKKEKKGKDPNENTTRTSTDETQQERVWTAEEQFGILKNFYNIVDSENPKTDDEVKAIISKRVDEGETELRPAQFKVLCHKLENRYDKNPITVWQDKLGKDSAETDEQDSANTDESESGKGSSSWSSWFTGGGSSEKAAKDDDTVGQKDSESGKEL